jgi:hypothetical protein
VVVVSGHLASKIILRPVGQEVHPLPGGHDLIVGDAVLGQIAGKEGRTVIGWRCISRT